MLRKARRRKVSSPFLQDFRPEENIRHFKGEREQRLWLGAGMSKRERRQFSWLDHFSKSLEIVAFMYWSLLFELTTETINLFIHSVSILDV